MAGYLLDTNVVSELRRPTPDPRVTAWFRSASGKPAFLSVLVLGEIRIGMATVARRDPRQAETIARWSAQLRRSFADRILPVTPEIAEQWAEFMVLDRIPVVDGLVAATAAVHGLTLATRNVKDVQRTGVAVVNPFESPPA